MDDVPFINALRQREDMENKIGGAKRPISLERDMKWVENILLGDNQSLVYFAVTSIEDDQIVGYTSISEIDYRNGSCFWSGIKLDSSRANKGWGTQVALKILKFVFEELRMERCKGECLEDHTGALRMMEKAGFQKEGLIRNSVYKNGKYNNQHIFAVIKEDYLKVKESFSL